MMGLLNGKLLVGNELWEKKQVRKSIEHHRQGGVGLGRDFRVLIAARNQLEQAAINQIQYLLCNERMWLLLHDTDITVRARLDVFRMCSKGLVQIERLLVRPHMRVKFQAFLVLENDNILNTLEFTP